MGYYPFVQECLHGHEWGAAFMSFNMTTSERNSCPICGCWKVRTKWTEGTQCHAGHKDLREEDPTPKMKGSNILKDDFPENDVHDTQ